MTTPRVPPAIRQLHAARDRALNDPGIATSGSRIERLHKATNTLERAAADLPHHAVVSLEALFADDVLGHPSQPDTVLGRVAAGRYRTRPPRDPDRPELTAASIRDLMDGIADLARAAGRTPFWWQARGARPWSKHTRQPVTPGQHVTLRRLLATPGPGRSEPFRLRLLTALEILWSTGCGVEGLIAADTSDYDAEAGTIRLTVNPPGRTEPTVQTFPLTENACAAINLWLPVRADVVNRHLREGADHPANQALFITLAHSVQSDAGTPRLKPPGLRITGHGLDDDYVKWARRVNADHRGKPGFPLLTDLYRISRGGAAELAERAAR